MSSILIMGFCKKIGSTWTTALCFCLKYPDTVFVSRSTLR